MFKKKVKKDTLILKGDFAFGDEPKEFSEDVV